MKDHSFLRSTFSLCLLITCSGASAAFAFAELRYNDPAQWTSEDVYQILNNSPWSKPVKVSLTSSGAGLLGSGTEGGNNSNVPNLPPPPGGIGGMGGGRRGLGSPSAGGTYSSGGNGRSTGERTSAPKSGPTQVIVQWQSARIVRLAAARKAEHPADPSMLAPQEEYVIAMIGLPVTAVGGRAASVDSDETVGAEEEKRIESQVRSSASLLRSGHASLTPSRVELDQGSDGRMLLHFPKSDPIQMSDRTVEFRLAIGRTELHKKFLLKEMEYQGKLDL